MVEEGNEWRHTNRQPLVAQRQEKGCCSLQYIAELYHIRDVGPFRAIMRENPIPDMQVLLCVFRQAEQFSQ